MLGQLSGTQLRIDEDTSLDIAVSGKVSKIIFYKEDDDFYIFTLQNPGLQRDIRVKGYSLNLVLGQEVDCSGKWESSPKFGDTFAAESISEFMPTTSEGIRKYLYSGAIPEISKPQADILVSWFGHRLFDVAESKPENLIDVPGLNAVRRNAIIDKVQENRAVPRIMMYLAEIGLVRGLAHKVFRDMGPSAVSKIQKNPYQLMRIPKVTFATADKVAKIIGIKAEASYRIVAAMESVLIKDSEKGSTLITRKKLLDEMCKILAIDGDAISSEKISKVIDSELKKKEFSIRRVINELEFISLKINAEAESRISKNIATIHDAPNGKRVSGNYLSSPRFSQLVPDQVAAAKVALSSNFSIITGRPGCGKTTITKSIVEVLQDSGLSVLMCAPTGRAARRIKEATGFTGLTIHRALGSRGENDFEFNKDNPLAFDVVLVDEVSMVDTYLMDKLMDAIKPGTKVIMVGDPDQLRSIGAGNILADLIKSNTVEVAVLSEIHRTAKGSSIVLNAHRIINGLIPEESAQGDFSMVASSGDNQVDMIIAQYKLLLSEGYSKEDIQILTPMRKTTELGANNLNSILKEWINPPSPNTSITKGKFDQVVTFSEGDRVMQIANNKELDIFNGDIGYIVKISRNVTTVNFSGQIVDLQKKDLDDLDLSYATTIHKSQGSEFLAIIIPISKHHSNMLDKNLLYTGATRGKKRVIFVGDLWMLKKSVEKTNNSSRITGLEDCLVSEFEKSLSSKAIIRKIRKSMNVAMS
jgi:exodeoxyribonuclease V alpha subunit